MVAESIPRRAASWLRWDASESLLVADPRARIFLASFALLFFELLCIRWITSYIRYLSYFNNFILLASFLGMGLGILAARRPRFRFPPFAFMLVLLTVVVALNRFDLAITSTDVLYFGDAQAQSARSESFIVLPVVFILVTLCFIPLARPLGRLLAEVKPLTAYTFDILGSLAGIASFFAISLFSLPPVVWFVLLAVPVLLLSGSRSVWVNGVLLVGSVVIAFQLQQGAYWSPYYKILLHKIQPSGYFVDVNNVGHQAMLPWREKEPFYRRVYEIFPGQTYGKVLILGAGTGSDTATALANGAQSVTAVEIDPQIRALGAALNPDKPYSDPRVHTVVDDGRAYLRNTGEKYDLIIFALPDSLTLTSSVTSLRLESFLLTQEAIDAARSRLNGDGLLVLYNYYREQWLVDKLAGMVRNAFGQDPLVSAYGGWGRAAVIMAGPRLSTLPPGRFGAYQERPSEGRELQVVGEGFYSAGGVRPATDDWPFLYLREQTFPTLYILALAMVVLVSLAGVLGIAPRSVLKRFDWHMFFLGMAFALLEVKSLTTFALLFGSTWLVNSLVFFAILTSVLLAVVINNRFKIGRIGVFYALLFGMILLNFALPPETLLFGNPALRYIVASFLAFAPVFLANVIFSNSFRDTEQADVAFASNLLGIMAGGMLEYFSMLIGYHMLLLPVALFYGLALVMRRRGSQQLQTGGALPAAESG
jgi:SAM-dependent methyltransferase